MPRDLAMKPTADIKCFATKIPREKGVDAPGMTNAPRQDTTGFCEAKHLTMKQRWVNCYGHHEWREIEIVNEEDIS